VRVWFIATAIWCVALAYRCWLGWPVMPIDVSANDPETLSAFNDAVASHVMAHAGAAVLGAGAVLVLGRQIKRAAKVRAGN